MLQKILTLLAFVIVVQTYAQQTPSKNIIDNGIKYYDDGNYSDAIETFSLVNENDSNYNWAVAEKAMTYLAMEKYDSTIIIANYGLSLPGNNHMHLMRTLGTAYDDMGNSEKAIEVYSQALKTYPYAYLLHYNLGITYLKNEDYEKAQRCFQEALRCNPFHASSHMQLGKMAARQKQFTRAMLSLETFLALEPASNRSNSILVYIENLSNNYIDTTGVDFIDTVDDNSFFEEVDHYFRAKVVLSDRYPLPVEFNASLVKQSKMLFDVLPLDTIIDDFWVQQYFPFYKKIKEGGHLESFLYTILRSTGNDNVQKYISKKEKELKEFYSTGSGLSKIKKMRYANITGERRLYEFSYYDSGEVNSIGNSNEEGHEVGEWQYFHSNGEMMAEGHFVNGKKDGEWKYYNEYGQLKSKENFAEGELNGEWVHYNATTGNKSVEANYINGKVDGDVIWYDEFGNVTGINHYIDDERNGPAAGYYSNGSLLDTFNYVKDEYEGLYTSYYPDGNISILKNYTEGKGSGEYKSYHANGQISSIGNLVDGEEEGRWRSYYPNGNWYRQETYKKGIVVGQKKEFNIKGIVSEEDTYDAEGNNNGVFKYYENDGTLNILEEHKDNKIVKVTSIDANGNEIASFGDENSTFDFITYDTKGRKITSGAFEEGKKSGEWILYHKNGNVFQKSNYQNSKLVSDVQLYYTNGQLKAKYSYEDGMLQGEYKKYEMNGLLITHGYYKDGNYDNFWTYYLDDGTLDQKVYYDNNIANGWATNYGVEGDTLLRIRYLNGKILAFQNYNSKGELLNEYDLLKSDGYQIMSDSDYVTASCSLKGGKYEGDFYWYHPNGKVSSKRTYLNDERNGEFRSYYYNGELRTEGQYLNGKRIGKWTGYYPDGKLYEEYYYVEGEKDSIDYTYYENGQVKLSQTYFNGILHGDVMHYDINGELMIKQIYDQDEFVGYQYFVNNQLCDTIHIKDPDTHVVAYYNNGVKSFEVKLKHYNYDGERIKYYSDGSVRQTRSFKSGLLEGPSINYYPNGQIRNKSVYKDDLREGKFVEYKENGNRKTSVMYKHGVEHGETKYYNDAGKLMAVADFWNGRIESYDKK